MSRLILPLLLSPLFLLPSCWVHKSRIEQLEAEQMELADAVETMAVGPEYLLSVSFISHAEGIDMAARDSIDAYLLALEDLHLILVERIPWGREGEMEYCVYAEKLDATGGMELLSRLSAFADRHERVFVSDEACRHK